MGSLADRMCCVRTSSVRVASALFLLILLAAVGLAFLAPPSDAAEDLGSISGVVTDSGGTGIATVAVHVYVAAEDGQWQEAGGASTGVDGRYQVSGLPDGIYRVQCVDSIGTYESRWYNGVTDLAAATDILVSAGEPSMGINVVLRSAEAPNDVPGAAVPDSPFWGWVGQDDRDDVYSIALTAGQAIRISLSAPEATDFDLRLFSPSVTSIATSSPVAASTRTYYPETIDYVALQSGAFHLDVRSYSGDGDYSIRYTVVDAGSISGSVTDAEGALGNATVSAWRIGGDGSSTLIASATTDSAGSYLLTGLPGGAYVVRFSATLHLTEYWLDSSQEWNATRIQVEEGLVTSGIDARLEPAGRIEGRVVDGNGLGVNNVSVYAYRDGVYYENSATSVIDGIYSLDALPAGTYKLYFVDYYGDYAWTWYRSAATSVSADPIIVTAGGATDAGDASLLAGGRISGTVTDTTGAPAVGVWVYANSDSGGWTDSAYTDVDGTYSIDHLPPGRYRVFFSLDREYISKWYTNDGGASGADYVTVPEGATVTGIDASLVKAVTIDGSVAIAGGDPLANATVAFERRSGSSWTYADSASTQKDGTYLSSSLQPGTYRVSFSRYDSKWLQQYWDGQLDRRFADLIELVGGDHMTGIDAVLQEGGSISGRVTNARGAPLQGVRILATSGDESRWTSSDATGGYSLDGLPPGSWKIEFSGDYRSYVPEWYDDKPDLAGADALTIGLGQAITGIDAVLTEYGRIRGSVTGAQGQPLAGISVAAYARDGRGYWNYVSDASTDATGAYSVRGLVGGDYRVAFYDHSNTYLGEFFDDKSDFDAADPVAVESGVATRGVDAQLTRASRVVGTVTSDSGEPLRSINVMAYRSDGDGGWKYVEDASTDASGRYTVRGLAAGTYRIGFTDGSRPQQWAPEFFDDATSVFDATNVPLAADDTATVDASLALGGSIAGTATDGSGEAAALLSVIAYRDDEEGGWEYVADTTTDATGVYRLGGLATGAYRLRFGMNRWGWSGDYVPEWYRDVSRVQDATDVRVTAGEETGPIDPVVSRGATVSGAVTSPAGPLADASVVAYRESGSGAWEYAADVTTDELGQYALRPLAPGTYKVRFFPSWPSGTLVGEWYNDQPTRDDADTLTIIGEEQLSGIDAELGEGSVIQGVVSADAGGVVGGVRVYAYQEDPAEGWTYVADATTDATGAYALRPLWPGSYRVAFSPGDPALDLAPEVWNDKPVVQLGDAIVLGSGETVADISPSLKPAAHLLGTVTDTSGAPLGETRVRAYLDGVPGARPLMGATVTTADGTYDLGGLPAGDYKVRFSHTGDYATQWYENKAGGSAADVVVLAAGQHQGQVNAVLGVPAVVSGVVTDSRGRGLQNARITAYQEDSGDWSYVADVTTDSTGGYRVAGLAADRYKLLFSDAGPFTYYLTEWFDDQATADVASTIDLNSGDAVTADATLAHVADITSISSSTHGEPATWYRSTDAAFDWLTAGPSMSAAEATQYDVSTTAVAGYSYSVDGSPDTPADKRVVSTTPSARITAPGDGIWYFHVRAVARPVIDFMPAWWEQWYSLSSWGATSSYPFRVDGTPPEVVVTRPEEGAGYVQGSDVTCSWSARDATSGIVSEVATIDGASISKGDRLDTLAMGEHVFILAVTDAAGGVTEVTRHFSVTSGSLSAIDVTAPVGGESLAQGADLPVAWTTNAAVTGGEFSLWLVSPANSWYGGAIVPADGSASYAGGLAADVPAAAGYRVFVYYRAATTDPWSIYGFAAGTVEVTAPAFSAISVTAPVGGESLAQGADLPVAWTTNAAVTGGEFSLWLVSPANSWYGGAIVPADGTASYAGGLAADVPAAAGYRVFVYYRVTPTDPWSIYGFAAGTVEVTAPAFSAISVTAPVGGESLAQGADLPVAWTTNAAVTGGEFSLWLVSPANSWYGGAIVPADGSASYAGGLAADVPAAAGYRVFVYYRAATTDPWSIYGFAAGTVEVTAPAFSAISVTAPVGGESLAQGADLPVAWTTNAAVTGGEFSLWLVSPANSWYGGAIVPADGSASYAGGLAADVPAAAGYRVFVYYRAATTDPWSIYGFAAGTVEVTAPAFSAISVTAPVGGESLAQGADLPVAWTTNAAVTGGEFSLWLVSPANSWYGGAIVPADGTASYAGGLAADVPAAAGYRVFVYYRVTPTDPWSIYGFAAGTVEVTAP